MGKTVSLKLTMAQANALYESFDPYKSGNRNTAAAALFKLAQAIQRAKGKPHDAA
jgi:hypothetical protein